MKAVASERRRFGYRRIHVMLQLQGIAMHIKKRWLDKTARRAMWRLCLEAAKMAAEQEIRWRSEHAETTVRHSRRR
jgi:putative transposase